MREVHVSKNFEGCDVESAFGILYVDSACLKDFHAAVNRDPAASIQAWDALTGSRALSFLKPVEAPAFIRKILGSDTLRVVENQMVSRDAVTGTITLVSIPCAEMKGADKFTTHVTMAFSATSTGCQVHGKVSCSAAGPFGLSGAIEGFMADTAKTSLEEFLDFCTVFLDTAGPEALAGGAAASQALLDALASVPVPSSPEGESEAEAWAEPDTAFLPALQGSELPEVLYLRYLCSTGDQGVALLQRIDGRLQGLAQQSWKAHRARDLVLAFAAGMTSAAALTALILSWRRSA